MHSRILGAVATIALLSAALAGCLGTTGSQSDGSSGIPPFTGGPEDGNGTAGADDGDPGDDGASSSDGNETGSGNGTAGDDTDGNATDDGSDGNATSEVGWPDPSAATIRPGVEIADRRCTANFVFSTPDNATLYIGTASHCVGGMSIGDGVKVAGQSAGQLVYCSWKVEMDTDTCPETSATGSRPDNDFALVKIHDAHRGTVHPKVLSWGGPSEIAASGPVSTGDRVLTYGNTPYRDAASSHDPREGVVASSGDWTSTAYFATPSVFGDSGSPVLTADGQALGVLATVVIAPLAGGNGFVHLDKAVGYMEDNTDLEVELKTWSVASPGPIP